MKMIRAIIVCLCLSTSNSLITKIPLPKDIEQCFAHIKTQIVKSRTVGEVTLSSCVHKLLWNKHNYGKPVTLADDAVRWIRGLVEMTPIYDSLSVGNDGFVVKHNGVDKHIGNITANHLQFLHHRHKRQSQFVPGQQSGQPTVTVVQNQVQGQVQGQGQGQTVQRRQPRIRREYRMLSDRERAFFHRAVNMLKADRTVSPNKYDALGRLHYMSVGRSHFGANFFPWHRLFLVVMENALREKIPSVTIPYWDSTLDDILLDPRSSIVWTPEFLGHANGFVENGPFANWVTPVGQLIRYFGTAGTLMNWTYIHNAFRQDHLADISTPNALADNNLEDHHNQVHQWVGGTMSPHALAAFDPVFYLLHSFMDMLWEIFRGLQKRRGIDPTIDYPRNNSGPPGHGYNDPSGFGTLLNRHALSDVFTDNIYKYDRPPSCTRTRPDCGSGYIRCDTSGIRPRCISSSIFDIRRPFTTEGLPMDGSSGRRELFKRSTHSQDFGRRNINELINHATEVKCNDNNINEKYANDFNINGVSDEKLWAYIPIKIIYKNNPNSNKNRVALYDQCMKRNHSDIPVRAFIESSGINYNGNFKYIAHFPKDLPISSSIAYVGVKKPQNSAAAEVLLSSYDNCGRVCQPYCLDRERNVLTKCPGAVRISKDAPLMYGSDVTVLTTALWGADANGIPELKDNMIYIIIVCDVNESFWPW